MQKTHILELLKQVSAGKVDPEQALLQLKQEPFTDIGYAKVDTHRELRQGAAEVIYGAGKTAQQICGICAALQEKGQKHILITRLDDEKARQIQKTLAADYDPVSHLAIIGGNNNEERPQGIIAVICAGTSDIAVAEEAARSAEFFGNQVLRIYDAGVAGLHRLLAHLDEIMSARVIIAVAGMEGALASVVAGLVDCPVVAVPTSIGYGANLGGISALLSMINSCAGGIGVVNIDNGFGAACLASRINHIGK